MADPTTSSGTDTSQMLEDLLIQRLLSNPSGSNIGTDTSQILGGAAGGNVAQEVAAADTQLRQGGLANQLFQSALNRAKAQAQMPTYGAAQAEAGDLLANTQDVGINASPALAPHLTTFTGGRRPSALGPNARQAGANLSAAGLANQSLQLPQVPTMPNITIPGSSVLDKVLQTSALATGLGGALAKGASGGSSGGPLDFLKNLFKGNQVNYPSIVTGGPDPFGNNLPGYQDPFGLNNGYNGGEVPGLTSGGVPDPSGGTGVGPGMQDYYDWLNAGGSGGPDPTNPDY